MYIGIDPGKSGALCILDTLTFYSLENYIEVLANHKDAKVCLEKVHALPNNGTRHAFAFGENYGYIRGILETLNIDYIEVTPAVWKKYFKLSANKQESIALCHKLYPQVDLHRTPRCKNEKHDYAEALLLAQYRKERNI